jgi:hypothetical protein
MKPGLVLRHGRLRGFPYGIALEAALCNGLAFAAMTATVIFSPCLFLNSKIPSALIAVCALSGSVSIHSERLEGDVTGMLAEVTGVLGAAGILIKACAVSHTAIIELLQKMKAAEIVPNKVCVMLYKQDVSKRLTSAFTNLLCFVKLQAESDETKGLAVMLFQIEGNVDNLVSFPTDSLKTLH